MARAAFRFGVFLLSGLIAQCVPGVQAGEREQPSLEVRKVLDLQRDGVNVLAFSPSSRELFVSHPVENQKLHQWNIATGKLIHTYSCPQDKARWDEVVVSPDGTLLIASTYPLGHPSRKCQVLFIDPRTQRVRYTAEYDYLIRNIRFDRLGRRIWITTTYPGPDDFVYDRDGTKHKDFKAANFEPKNWDRLRDVAASKGGPPSGLFYRDTMGKVHHLTKDSLNQDYALTVDGAYIGTSTWDQRVRIWRTSDLQEVFNEEIGAHAVRLVYDSKESQFLFLDGMDGNTFLRAVRLPREAGHGQDGDAANRNPPIRSETKRASSAHSCR